MQPSIAMSAIARNHARHAKRLLDHADDHDRLLASKKIWGSVAYTLKEIGAKHGWPHASNTDLASIAGYLAAVSGDNIINHEYVEARSFLSNAYEDEYPLDWIKEGVRLAEGLIERLNDVDGRVTGGR